MTNPLAEAIDQTINATLNGSHPELPPLTWRVYHQGIRNTGAVTIHGEVPADAGHASRIVQAWGEALKLSEAESFDSGVTFRSSGQIGRYAVYVWGIEDHNQAALTKPHLTV
jgi:hypothetical protein